MALQAGIGPLCAQGCAVHEQQEGKGVGYQAEVPGDTWGWAVDGPWLAFL